MRHVFIEWHIINCDAALYWVFESDQSVPFIRRNNSRSLKNYYLECYAY